MAYKDTTFRQMLQFIPRYEFQKAVKSYSGEFAAKGFSCWQQFTAMLYGQLSGQTGLRGIESGLQATEKKNYHLGIKPITRSTLAYANSNRSHEIYQELFYSMVDKLMRKNKTRKLNFKNPLYSVDATTIDLCLSTFDWAHFRKAKGGIKLHVKLDHRGYLPAFVSVTTAKTHEVNELKKMQFKAGDVVTFDRGYIDFNLFAKYCNERIYFVTRLKSNADYTVLERKDVSSYPNISSDQNIVMKGFYTSQKCPLSLRRIRSKDPDTGKYIVILTNNFDWTPEQIAAIYKERWQIEIFFKTIKQNLKIKSFLGTSKNAVLTQIWIALIAYLLLWYLAYLSQTGWTINSLMHLVPTILFLHKDIWTILNRAGPTQAAVTDNSLQLELI